MHVFENSLDFLPRRAAARKADHTTKNKKSIEQLRASKKHKTTNDTRHFEHFQRKLKNQQGIIGSNTILKTETRRFAELVD